MLTQSLRLASMLGAATLFVGCLDASTGNHSVDPTTPVAPTPTDPTDPTSKPAVAVIDWVNLTWCAPAPVSYDVSQLPTLPAGVQTDGFCQADTLTAPEGGESVVQVSFDPAAMTFDVSGASPLDGGDGNSFTLDDDGYLRQVVTRGAGGFYGAEFGDSTYQLNTAGEMTYKIAAGPVTFTGGSGTFVKTQKWDGNRLVNRTERAGTDDGPLLREWNWAWNTLSSTPRLTDATLTDRPDDGELRTVTATFAYHPSGAPASVTRAIDGITVQTESWTFDADGRLTSRNFESTSAEDLLAQHGQPTETVLHWTMPKGLDSFQTSIGGSDGYDGVEDPWAASLVQQTANGCHNLPRGAGHGYPNAEQEYQLGVARDAVARGTGELYGARDGRWTYQDRGWYGHHGVGSAWLWGLTVVPNTLSMTASATVRYDDNGRMVEEVSELVEPDGAAVSVTRNRLTDEAGFFTEDRVSMVRADAEPIERSLRFKRDEKGHLLGRTLVVSSVPVEEQSWTWSDAGDVIEHTFSGVNGWREAGSGVAAAADWFATTASPPALDAAEELVWRWAYDASGLLVERESPNKGLQTLTYDEASRLIERVGVWTTGDSEINTWEYDEDGRETLGCNTQGDYTHCTETTFDTAGRVAWETITTEGPEVTNVYVMVHSYVCAP